MSYTGFNDQSYTSSNSTEFLMQQVVGHKRAFLQNYFLFFPCSSHPHCRAVAQLKGRTLMHRQSIRADFKCACAQVDKLPGLEEGTLELLQATLPTQPGVKLHSFALRESIPELFTHLYQQYLTQESSIFNML